MSVVYRLNCVSAFLQSLINVMDSFQSRSNALEGMYFRGREQTAMETYVRKLVDEGKLPSSTLNFFEQEKLEIRARPTSEFVYRHTKKQGPRKTLFE